MQRELSHVLKLIYFPKIRPSLSFYKKGYFEMWEEILGNSVERLGVGKGAGLNE